VLFWIDRDVTLCGRKQPDYNREIRVLYWSFFRKPGFIFALINHSPWGLKCRDLAGRLWDPIHRPGTLLSTCITAQEHTPVVPAINFAEITGNVLWDDVSRRVNHSPDINVTTPDMTQRRCWKFVSTTALGYSCDHRWELRLLLKTLRKKVASLAKSIT
jgi:hypothetical protein